jgi:hypothetical protein
MRISKVWKESLREIFLVIRTEPNEYNQTIQAWTNEAVDHYNRAHCEYYAYNLTQALFKLSLMFSTIMHKTPSHSIHNKIVYRFYYLSCLYFYSHIITKMTNITPHQKTLWQIQIVFFVRWFRSNYYSKDIDEDHRLKSLVHQIKYQIRSHPRTGLFERPLLFLPPLIIPPN